MEKKKAKDPILLIFTLTALLSIISKLYSGPGQLGISYYLNSISVVVTYCILISLIFPELKYSRVALAVFLFMTFFEIMQILFPEQFSIFRNGLRYPRLLDTHGSWHKIPFYGIAGFFGMKLLKNYKK